MRKYPFPTTKHKPAFNKHAPQIPFAEGEIRKRAKVGHLQVVSSTFQQLCTADPQLRTSDSQLCTSDSLLYTADSLLCTSDSSLYTSDSALCIADSHLCTADLQLCIADSSLCTSDSGLCTPDFLFLTADCCLSMLCHLLYATMAEEYSQNKTQAKYLFFSVKLIYLP